MSFDFYDKKTSMKEIKFNHFILSITVLRLHQIC